MAKQTITRSATTNTIRVSYGRNVNPSNSSTSTKPSSTNTKSSSANTSAKAVKPQQNAARKQTTK